MDPQVIRTPLNSGNSKINSLEAGRAPPLRLAKEGREVAALPDLMDLPRAEGQS